MVTLLPVPTAQGREEAAERHQRTLWGGRHQVPDHERPRRGQAEGPGGNGTGQDLYPGARGVPEWVGVDSCVRGGEGQERGGPSEKTGWQQLWRRPKSWCVGG